MALIFVAVPEDKWLMQKKNRWLNDDLQKVSREN